MRCPIPPSTTKHSPPSDTPHPFPPQFPHFLSQDRLYEEMLWSDPRAGLAGKQLSSRGAGIEFGQDVTFDFLRTNQLALIVRSHECVNEGTYVGWVGLALGGGG